MASIRRPVRRPSVSDILARSRVEVSAKSTDKDIANLAFSYEFFKLYNRYLHDHGAKLISVPKNRWDCFAFVYYCLTGQEYQGLPDFNPDETNIRILKEIQSTNKKEYVSQKPIHNVKVIQCQDEGGNYHYLMALGDKTYQKLGYPTQNRNTAIIEMPYDQHSKAYLGRFKNITNIIDIPCSGERFSSIQNRAKLLHEGNNDLYRPTNFRGFIMVADERDGREEQVKKERTNQMELVNFLAINAHKFILYFPIDRLQNIPIT